MTYIAPYQQETGYNKPHEPSQRMTSQPMKKSKYPSL